MPRGLLITLSYPLSGLERILGITFPINRVRIRKLFRSNNVLPAGLRELNYPYTYTLESAFSDWKKEVPDDFSASVVTTEELTANDAEWNFSEKEALGSLLPRARKP